MKGSIFFEAISEARSILLLTHQNPDIDGLSCMLAFTLLFPEKAPLPLVEEIPSNASFLHGFSRLKLTEEIKDLISPDLVILFDASCERRISEKLRAKVKDPKLVLVFDHHQREDCAELFGAKTYFIINPEEASTSILFYRFLKEAGFSLTPEIAENLLAGIYYDTGSFRYENVKGDIFQVVQELVTLGARPSYVAQALYENFPLSQVKALRIVLNRLRLLNGGKIALSFLTFEDLQDLGGERAINDLASFLRSIQGVKYGALVKEVEKGRIKVSLRSKAPWEILPLAKEYGGGGHRYACGFQVKRESLEEFLKDFEEKLVRLP